VSALSNIGARDPEAPALGAAGLPRRAWPFFGIVVAVSAIAAALVMPGFEATRADWHAFLVLVACAAVAHAFVVHTPRNQIFHMGLVFTVAGAVLLPPELLVLLCLLQHVSDWAKERYPWYIQLFNMCNYTLAALGASRAVQWLPGLAGVEARQARLALAGVGGAAAFVAVNHALLAPMLSLARRHSVRETGLFSFDSLSTDLVLACLGAGLAVLWRLDLWALPLALSPLLLIHRALAVPQLRAEARVDPKTGLVNARHFGNELAAELERAVRFGRPLSVLMADLDLLRSINNEHGHLAGDAVIGGVADILRVSLRDYDTACRFGGEEFAILLPETSPERAHEIAGRIRSVVARRTFRHDGANHEPVRATISIGVAAFPRDATEPDQLLHAADLALYRAKRDGRNRIAS
jgi:diguanylate cyclase (GGDEF)-like protein